MALVLARERQGIMVMVIDKIKSKLTSRNIQLAIGLLWLVNGLLQLQPKMMTSAFANKVIVPAASGQPVFVRDPMHFAVSLILSHPAFFDVCFGLAQLAIGALIIFKKTARTGLIASAIWGLGVWYFGEGAGGIFSGHALLLTGAPGAALLYALISLGVIGPSKQPADWLKYVWTGLWVGSGLLLLWARATPALLSHMVFNMSNGAPNWIASIDRHAASWLAAKNSWQLLIFVGVYFAIGLSALIRSSWRYLGIGAGIIIALFIWIVGQSLGGYYTGLATDLNTAPLIILLALSIF